MGFVGDDIAPPWTSLPSPSVGMVTIWPIDPPEPTPAGQRACLGKFSVSDSAEGGARGVWWRPSEYWDLADEAYADAEKNAIAAAMKKARAACRERGVHCFPLVLRKAVTYSVITTVTPGGARIAAAQGPKPYLFSILTVTATVTLTGTCVYQAGVTNEVPPILLA